MAWLAPTSPSAPGGTAAFMAPEQLRGERGDASADLSAAALAKAPPRFDLTPAVIDALKKRLATP